LPSSSSRWAVKASNSDEPFAGEARETGEQLQPLEQRVVAELAELALAPGQLAARALELGLELAGEGLVDRAVVAGDRLRGLELLLERTEGQLAVDARDVGDPGPHRGGRAFRQLAADELVLAGQLLRPAAARLDGRFLTRDLREDGFEGRLARRLGIRREHDLGAPAAAAEPGREAGDDQDTREGRPGARRRSDGTDGTGDRELHGASLAPGFGRRAPGGLEAIRVVDSGPLHRSGCERVHMSVSSIRR
jgi:hypothetical protein